MSVKSVVLAVLRFARDAEPVIAAGGATAAVTATSAAWVGYESHHLTLGLAAAAASAVSSLVLAIIARGQVTPSEPDGTPKHARP